MAKAGSTARVALAAVTLTVAALLAAVAVGRTGQAPPPPIALAGAVPTAVPNGPAGVRTVAGRRSLALGGGPASTATTVPPSTPATTAAALATTPATTTGGPGLFGSTTLPAVGSVGDATTLPPSPTVTAPSLLGDPLLGGVVGLLDPGATTTSTTAPPPLTLPSLPLPGL